MTLTIMHPTTLKGSTLAVVTICNKLKMSYWLITTDSVPSLMVVATNLSKRRSRLVSHNPRSFNNNHHRLMIGSQIWMQALSTDKAQRRESGWHSSLRTLLSLINQVAWTLEDKAPSKYPASMSMNTISQRQTSKTHWLTHLQATS